MISLEERTQGYWWISQLRNHTDLPEELVTVELALTLLNGILEVTPPAHPLRRRTLDLQDDIIIGGEIEDEDERTF